MMSNVPSELVYADILAIAQLCLKFLDVLFEWSVGNLIPISIRLGRLLCQEVILESTEGCLSIVLTHWILWNESVLGGKKSHDGVGLGQLMSIFHLEHWQLSTRGVALHLKRTPLLKGKSAILKRNSSLVQKHSDCLTLLINV